MLFNIFFSKFGKHVTSAITGRKSPEPDFADLDPDFEITVLGARSGMAEGNLSAYMIRTVNGDDALLCDAGTLGHGLKQAETLGAFDHLPLDTSPTARFSRAGQVLDQVIKAYLISHAHLDHVAGLVLASPDDTPKPLLALEETNNLLSAHLFNNKIWGNQYNKGTGPVLGKYSPTSLAPGEETAIQGSSFTVRAWPLTHGEAVSTAFLLHAHGKEVLYIGDTETDDKSKPENEQRLRAIWHAVAPSIREGRLKTIMIEATYPDSQPDHALCGHMTPTRLLDALRDLALICGGRHYIRSLRIIVTHVKETLANGEDPARQIARNLNDGNDMGLCFLIARQGARYLV